MVEKEVAMERVATRVSVRFGHVVLPFDIREFVGILGELGYTVQAELPPEPASGDAAISGSGPVATREDETVVDVNTERQFFGVASQDPLEAWERLDEILRALTMRGLTSEERVLFYEFQGRYKVFSFRSLEALREQGKKLGVQDLASKLFGVNLGVSGLRLHSVDSPVDSRNYFEIQLEVPARKPGTEIALRVVFRIPDADEFEGFVSGLEVGLSSLAASLFEDLEAD